MTKIGADRLAGSGRGILDGDRTGFEIDVEAALAEPDVERRMPAPPRRGG